MLVTEGKAARSSLGNSEWSMQKSEEESRRLRRSLYVVKDVEIGDLVTSENVRAIRPGYGAPPKHYSEFLGKKFAKSCKRGTPMSSELLENK